MNEENKPGHYRDSEGVWQKDRRKASRRKDKAIINHHDRRSAGRRKSDREFDERESREAIADALDDLVEGKLDDD
jgi:hypothetical protein